MVEAPFSLAYLMGWAGEGTGHGYGNTGRMWMHTVNVNVE